MTFKTFFYEQTFSGLAKGKSLEDLAKKHNVSVEHLNSQLKKGIEVEHEHTKDSVTAKKIAMDHLFEDPDYYTKLKKVEEKSIHDPVRPGILKRQVKGKMTCSKARTLKGKQKNKGNNTAKAAQRFLNYHC
jgi:hypothetical protein